MSEIEFGDLEHAAPRTGVPPDQNRHFAVVPCQRPGADELAIYVDVDALRDMEDHARSEPDVELGGVMLGGQHVDEQGRPFIVITDVLRAQHYRSSRGSFTFTHETWAEMTRQRDEFPRELEMVGWYHTHPDWGVFLSGLDLFICNHFFNRPLDVALVIDPCRGDRGFFQWLPDAPGQTRRTGGFYLIGSRFRQSELEHYAAYLERQLPMATSLRSTGYPPSGQGPPVVQLVERPGHWTQLATLGMLAIQLLLVVLLAWQFLAPGAGAASDQRRQLAALEARLERSEAARSAESELQAYRRLLELLVGDLMGDASLVEQFAALEQHNQQLDAALRGQRALERELRAEQERTALALAASQRVEQTLAARVEQLEQANRRYQQQLAAWQRRAGAVDEAPSDVAEADDGGWRAWAGSIRWPIATAALALLVVCGIAAVVGRRLQSSGSSRRSGPDEDDQDEP